MLGFEHNSESHFVTMSIYPAIDKKISEEFCRFTWT